MSDSTEMLKTANKALSCQTNASLGKAMTIRGNFSKKIHSHISDSYFKQRITQGTKNI